jgi:hypothetical protein
MSVGWSLILATILFGLKDRAISNNWIFASSRTGTSEAAAGQKETTLTVTLSSPKSHNRINCGRTPEGIYKCPVKGTSKSLSRGNFQLLLWVRPVRPAGDGWYLQKGVMNGIHSVGSDGNWEGIAQVGNLEYPPHEGDRIEIAVSVATSEEVRRLLGSEGVVVRGTVSGKATDTAKNVTMHLE